MLTRESVESDHKEALETIAALKGTSSENGVMDKRAKRRAELCRGYLAWLDVQPVKIKDLPIDCDSAIGFRGDGLNIIFRFGMDRWSTSAISRPWDDEDCAIPLSAILALKTPGDVI